MMERTVVRADCVRIHENVIETGRDESHDRDEPSRRRRLRLGACGAIHRDRWGCKGQSGGYYPDGLLTE